MEVQKNKKRLEKFFKHFCSVRRKEINDLRNILWNIGWLWLLTFPMKYSEAIKILKSS